LEIWNLDVGFILGFQKMGIGLLQISESMRFFWEENGNWVNWDLVVELVLKVFKF